MRASLVTTGFADSLKEIPGLDAQALLAALETDPACGIRLNVRKNIPDEAPLYPEMRAVEWCSATGRYLRERPCFTLNPLLHAGVFYVQDPSSMIYQQVAERLVGMLGKPEPLLLDFCAAPGGKTTALINALPDGSGLVANEFVPLRGKILRENLEKWGFPNVITTGDSSAAFARLPEMFDIVAVDAPCSGEGMMRKDDEARRQWSAVLVEQCAALQREILTDLVGTLRPGGFLIYSTCTFNLSEDEQNALFIMEELGLENISAEDIGLKGIENVGRSVMPEVKGLRFMPHLTDGEGLFIAIFRKPGQAAHLSIPEHDESFISGADTFAASSSAPLRKERMDKKSLKREREAAKRATGRESRMKGGAPKGGTVITQGMKAEAAGWFEPAAGMEIISDGESATALPASMLPVRDKLMQAGVRITGSGLPAASLKGSALQPDSRLVLSSAYRRGTFSEVELTAEDALRFLRRESFSLPENIERGYIVVSFEGHPLGLMKNLGNRANNLLPSSWRIRIQ